MNFNELNNLYQKFGEVLISSGVDSHKIKQNKFMLNKNGYIELMSYKEFSKYISTHIQWVIDYHNGYIELNNGEKITITF